MAQGNGRCTVPKARRNPPKPIVQVLANKIVRAKIDHQLMCGCLLAAGKNYHKCVAILKHPESNSRVFVAEKSHAGPCPKSGVIH